MSRGGRGGRGGQNKSFSREQLGALGVSSNEVLPGPVTQPPPLFPLLDHKPIPLIIHNELQYQVMLKHEYVEFLKDSPAYIRIRNNEVTNRNEDRLAKLLSQIPNIKNEFNWNLFPAELRPKMVAKRMKNSSDTSKSTVDSSKSEMDISKRLETLEKLEKTPISVKQEPEEENEAEEVIQEDEEDEEMDDGTDYANNYFDNGEGYDDEDENLDDGPCY